LTTKATTKSATSPKPELVESAKLPLVKWYDNGWRFGRLLTSGPKWSFVLHLGHRRRIPNQEISSYA